MSRKSLLQRKKLVCAECGKTQCKYREFVGAYLCNACYNKFEIEKLEQVEKDNKKKSRKKNKDIKTENIKDKEENKEAENEDEEE